MITEATEPNYARLRSPQLGDWILHTEGSVPQAHTTLTDIIATYWPVLAFSFVVSLAATPLCRRLARRRNLVDRPDDFLKRHARPMPYLGGVAIFLGWTAGILLALIQFEQSASLAAGRRDAASLHTGMMAAILLAGLAIVALGLFDDLRLLSPVAKLLGAAAIAAALISVGVGDDIISIVLRSTGFQVDNLPRWLILIYSVPLTLLITTGACHATNLLDGLDGLCSGVLGIIAAGFLILAVHLHVWGQWDPFDVQRVVLALAMMGAALGFLPYNRNPATIFMGDAGSMLLGLNAAVLLLLFAESHAVRWFLGAAMVFGLPIADLILTVVRRWRNEHPIMRGDRSHFYDQLIDRGMSVRRVVTISYGLATFFAIVGCLAIVLRTRYVILLYVIVAAGAAVATARFRMVRLEHCRPLERDREHSSLAGMVDRDR